MKTKMMEKNVLFAIDTNDYMEIIPGFIPDKQDMQGKMSSPVLTENNRIEDIRKNIVHLEICLTRIKNSVKSL